MDNLYTCHVMSCHVMSCHVMSCHVMSCHVMSCHVMSCHVMSCHVMSCHVMSCHVMSCIQFPDWTAMTCHAPVDSWDTHGTQRRSYKSNQSPDWNPMTCHALLDTWYTDDISSLYCVHTEIQGCVTVNIIQVVSIFYIPTMKNNLFSKKKAFACSKIC